MLDVGEAAVVDAGAVPPRELAAVVWRAMAQVKHPTGHPKRDYYAEYGEALEDLRNGASGRSVRARYGLSGYVSERLKEIVRQEAGGSVVGEGKWQKTNIEG